MKNSLLLTSVLALWLVNSCAPESESSTFYAMYPEKEPMKVTGVVPTCDGFMILGYHPQQDMNGSIPTAALLRVDEAGKIIASWQVPADLPLAGPTTNMLLAPNGDIYFGARLITGNPHSPNPETIPLLFRLQKTPSTCDYLFSRYNSALPEQWLMYPAGVDSTGWDQSAQVMNMAIAWDTATQQVLTYTVLNNPSFPGSVCLGAMSPEGIRDATRQYSYSNQCRNIQESPDVNNYSVSPVLVKTANYLYYTSPDFVSENKINLNIVYTGPDESLKGRQIEMDDSYSNNIYGLIHARTGTPYLPFGASGPVYLDFFRYYLLSRYQSVGATAPQTDLRVVDDTIPEGHTLGVAPATVLEMSNLRFREGNNILLRPLSNHRYLIAGADRNGGIELTVVDNNGNEILQHSLLNGSDFMPAAVCEASNEDIVIAGSVLTFDRTSTVFLLRVNCATGAFTGL